MINLVYKNGQVCLKMAGI